MGTTLHAIVEVFSASRTVRYGDGEVLTTTDHWWELGTWEFNKNYTLSIWLHDHADEDWPRDSRALTEEYYKPCDTDRQWCTAEDLRDAVIACKAKDKEYDEEDKKERALALTLLAEETDEPSDSTSELEALVASLGVLEQRGWRVRVLWYRL